MESNDMIDPQKRTIEALTLELDRVNAENAALKASLSAPQAAGVDLDKNKVLARIDELTDDIDDARFYQNHNHNF